MRTRPESLCFAAPAIVVVALSVTLLGACSAAKGPSVTAAAPASPTSADAGPLFGVDWIFTWVDGFAGKLPGDPPVPGFTITVEGRRMTGSTACNRMASGYILGIPSGTLSFPNIVNTRMMCDRVAADTEESVLKTMIETDGFRLADGNLELMSKGRLVARLRPR